MHENKVEFKIDEDIDKINSYVVSSIYRTGRKVSELFPVLTWKDTLEIALCLFIKEFGFDKADREKAQTFLDDYMPLIEIVKNKREV